MPLQFFFFLYEVLPGLLQPAKHVLFKQMIGLGIEPNRLYIAIINDDSGDLEFWITDENGEKVSSRYMVNIHKNISIKKMHEGWAAKKKTITIDMQGCVANGDPELLSITQQIPLPR